MKLLKYELFQSAAGDGKDITITKEIPWSEANYANALTEAYNGEITVENVPDPVTHPTTEECVAALEDALCEMDAANAASIAALEDALCEIDAGGM